jgi:four helix bundle protein
MQRNKIISFKDLEVYTNSYKVMIMVMKEILPNLPELEKYDLSSQISRACKAIPRLIAEGYARRHQKAGFRKYLDDAMAECNEMVVNLEQCRDIYNIKVDLIKDLIIVYDKTGRQLYKLAMAWSRFKRQKT